MYGNSFFVFLSFSQPFHKDKTFLSHDFCTIFIQKQDLLTTRKCHQLCYHTLVEEKHLTIPSTEITEKKPCIEFFPLFFKNASINSQNLHKTSETLSSDRAFNPFGMITERRPYFKFQYLLNKKQ